MSKAGVVILNWNGHIDTVSCIESIVEHEQNRHPIFLVDNGSQKQSIQYIEDWLNKHYVYPFIIISDDEFMKFADGDFDKILYFIKSKKNLGFAKGNNIVWQKIWRIYDYVLLLNNDTVITKGAITRMVQYLDNNPDTGALSCDIRYYAKPDKLWNAGGYFTWYGDRKYYSQKKIDKLIKKNIEAIRTPFITGCALMVPQKTTKIAGTFTERFFFGEEDFNYCKKLLNNHIVSKTLLTSTIYHKVGTSLKKTQQDDVNGTILHFSNRVINFKEFYGKRRWKIWRKFYIMLVYIKLHILIKDRKKVKKAINYIEYYTSKYDEITYTTFQEIINLPKIEGRDKRLVR
ncbi:MAG: glycosyltransferase family 2 protein [Eubacteriaceae bacterium]|jgi:GT2 family glycosyltransferase|nr:glycosyltransferase family 2 protein [Eubacteriaceae bacterium]